MVAHGGEIKGKSVFSLTSLYKSKIDVSVDLSGLKTAELGDYAFSSL